jgi:hypothetical protein
MKKRAVRAYALGDGHRLGYRVRMHLGHRTGQWGVGHRSGAPAPHFGQGIGIEMRGFLLGFSFASCFCGVFVFPCDKRVKHSNADVGCLSAPHAERRSGGCWYWAPAPSGL